MKSWRPGCLPVISRNNRAGQKKKKDKQIEPTGWIIYIPWRRRSSGSSGLQVGKEGKKARRTYTTIVNICDCVKMIKLR